MFVTKFKKEEYIKFSSIINNTLTRSLRNFLWMQCHGDFLEMNQQFENYFTPFHIQKYPCVWCTILRICLPIMPCFGSRNTICNTFVYVCVNKQLVSKLVSGIYFAKNLSLTGVDRIFKSCYVITNIWLRTVRKPFQRYLPKAQIMVTCWTIHICIRTILT